MGCQGAKKPRLKMSLDWGDRGRGDLSADAAQGGLPRQVPQPHDARRAPAARQGELGIRPGAWCLGCCWGLMAALFAVGVMSLDDGADRGLHRGGEAAALADRRAHDGGRAVARTWARRGGGMHDMDGGHGTDMQMTP